jgi:3-hydroxyisobutyrate dehydrogenase-like beta-hydroxyacid dehydrogenase
MVETSRIGMEPVSVLGLGAMGTAIARRLVDDAAVTGWNRTPGKAGDLFAAGVSPAATAIAAVEASRVVMVSLADNDAVRAVLDHCGHAFEGRDVINLTNGTPEEARDLSSAVAAVGGRYLHGAVMAVPPMLGTPAATILYSGAEEVFQRAEPLLTKLGAARLIGDDAGRAPLFEFALLSIMYGLYGGFLHAAATVVAERQPIEDLARLAVPWATGLASALPRLAQQISDRSYDRDVSSTLSMQAHGLDHFSQWGAEHGIAGDFIEPMRRLMKARLAAGFGDHGIASIFELIRGE